MGDDTINNENEGLGGQDSGTIVGGGADPVNPPAPNPGFPIPDEPDPEPTPTPSTPASGGENEFLKYVKMANDLHWIPGILKAYGADNQLPFGKVEEEAYEENEETEKLVFPNEYWDKEADADETLEEEVWSPETKEPQVDEELEEEIFNDQPGPVFDQNEDLEEEIFGNLYGEAIENADETFDEETVFGVESYAAESAAAESPLNQGEAEDLDEYTFNLPEKEADTFTPDYPAEIGDGAAEDAEKIRDMLKKLLPSEDAEGAVKDPEWTFGKFMKAKFPDFVASDRAAKFLDLVAQYSVVDAVERLAVQEAKEEVLAAATGDEDQDELLALVQESADTKRKQYLTDYVMPPAEGEPAKYRKFWKEVVDIIKAL